MSLLIADIKIKGTRPLLFNRFTIDTISLHKKEQTGVAGNDPEEWKRTYSATSDGQLYLDSSYIFGCIREAAKYTKSGRASIQTKVAATLQILTNKALINRFVPRFEDITQDPTQPVYIDIRSVRNPSTKGRNIRYRLALSEGWETSFQIMWENTLVNRTQMEAVVIDAGKLVGLGDGRSIGFGRFDVVEFHIKEYQKNA
ncbi:hypothetical protein [Parageobacillus toebii]|uniref:hypothetical protein n=1 Tax=Parageobacillus toebii TaxID=153151 RepID=UPI0028168012|nr:hypothetical protein [Parageobacillus toebii]WMT18437.1 hypothetical protein RFB12_14250 [Parageobacillus toebii]